MRIAIAVFEGAEELDFVGPWEVLAAWRFLYPDDVEVLLVGEDSAPVTCAKGMKVVAHTTWDEVGDVNVLVYPGGRGTRTQLGDEHIRSRLRGMKERGTLMTSVCTGALVYADAGLLDGQPAKIAPSSVVAPVTRPPSSRSPGTGQPTRMLAPCKRASSAQAGRGEGDRGGAAGSVLLGAESRANEAVPCTGRVIDSAPSDTVGG